MQEKTVGFGVEKVAAEGIASGNPYLMSLGFTSLAFLNWSAAAKAWASVGSQFVGITPRQYLLSGPVTPSAEIVTLDTTKRPSGRYSARYWQPSERARQELGL